MSGESLYTGAWGTSEAEGRYRDLVSQWRASGFLPPSAWESDEDKATLAQVMVSYIKVYLLGIRYKNNPESHEILLHKSLFAIVSDCIGHVPAKNLRVRHFSELRDFLISRPIKRDPSLTLSHESVTKAMSRLKACLRWAVEKELIEPPVLTAAEAVLRSLRPGERGVRETEPVGAAEDALVDQIVAVLAEPAKTIVRILRLSGARPSELCLLTRDQLDMSDPGLWKAKLKKHKTAWRGKKRTLRFGAEAIVLLRPFVLKSTGGPLFLTTKGTQFERPHLADRIRTAARNLGVEPFNPNQLRHAFATGVANEQGEISDELATSMGHSATSTTKTYADLEREGKADDLMRRIG